MAGEAEAQTPVIKEVKQEQPLHFKYYKNDNESLAETLVDNMLTAASGSIEKQQVKLPYDDKAYEKEIGVTPL